MAGTLVSVFIDDGDRITPTNDGRGLRIEAVRPAGAMGIGDDWVLFIHHDHAVETFDRLIEALQDLRALELRRLVEEAGAETRAGAPA